MSTELIKQKIAEIQRMIETLDLEIEWNELIGGNIEYLNSQKTSLELEMQKYQGMLEEKVESLGNEYYDKVLGERITGELGKLKKKFFEQRFLSEDDKDQVRAYSKILNDTGILNDAINKKSRHTFEDKFKVEIDERAMARRDRKFQGYAYQDVLEMCQRLLESNPEKYFDIIFYNPDIEIVKPELLNWFVNRFNIIIEVGKLITMPAYMIDYLSKENIDKLAGILEDNLGTSDEIKKQVLSVILRSPYVSSIFVKNNIDIIRQDSYLCSLVVSNPSLPVSIKVLFSQINPYIKAAPEMVYDKMVNLRYKEPLNLVNLNMALDSNIIDFNNPITGEVEWNFNLQRYVKLETKDSVDCFSERITECLSFHAVLIGNDITYNRIEKFISVNDLEAYASAFSRSIGYVLSKDYKLNPKLCEYVNDIISALIVIYSKIDRLESLERYLLKYKNACIEAGVSSLTVTLNDDNKARLAEVIDDGLDLIARTKAGNLILKGSTANVYTNDYTIDDIDRLYVKEVLGKKRSLTL